MKVKGKMIRDARTEKGYSQEYVADILGISQSQYSKLENGETSFEIEELSQLIDLLELNPLEVLEFTDKQMVFINSACSGNNGNNNSNSFITNDTDIIRKIVQEELKKQTK
jgi:transcriptional regulator with XRE-family HTH domain